MDSVNDLVEEKLNGAINTLNGFSSRKKLLTILIIWAIIFLTISVGYASVHKNTQTAYYPENAAPIDVEQDDWQVTISPFDEVENERYHLSVPSGEPIEFNWTAEHYDDPVHIGSVTIHYETSWGREGKVRLHHRMEQSPGSTETWKANKTFYQSGNISYYIFLEKGDIPRFARRGSVIAEGRNLYEDTRTGPPPLINFFFVPPAVLAPALQWGGNFISFYLYFSLFILVDAFLLFFTFKRFGEGKALLGSVLFLANPVTMYATFQDEGIIVFTILVSLYLIYHERGKLASLTIGMGLITKIWSGFLIPAQLFLRDTSLKKRILHMAVSIGTGLALLALFVKIWGEKTLWFIGFYGGGASKSTVGGVSVWAYLAETPLISKTAFPATVILVILAVSEVMLLIYAYKKKIDLLQFYTCSLALFLIIYPKVHWEYHLMIFPPLIHYATRGKRFLYSFFGLSLLLLGTRGIRNFGSYPDGATLVFAIICSSGVVFLLLYWIRELLVDPKPTQIVVKKSPKE